MDLKLSGRKALITGASQGIGRGIAEAFAEEGVSLHLTARNAESLQQIEKQIRESHEVDVTVHPFDLTEAGACDGLSRAAGWQGRWPPCLRERRCPVDTSAS